MKMEGIELYPHNQKAYDNLCAMLRDSNRACVVQPTGWHRTIRERTFFF